MKNLLIFKLSSITYNSHMIFVGITTLLDEDQTVQPQRGLTLSGLDNGKKNITFQLKKHSLGNNFHLGMGFICDKTIIPVMTLNSELEKGIFDLGTQPRTT